MKTPIVDQIMKLFAAGGTERYGGEAVNQTQHALQAALAAEQAHAPPEQVVAALLHDIGHLLHNLPDDCADQGIDDRHEELGYRFLRTHFVPAVAEAVRLHVPAKRYLTAVEPGYRESLSPASVQSLALQGGPMSPAEQAEFEANAHYRDALALRRRDDVAKIAGLETPDLEHYRPYLEMTLAAR